MAFFNPYKGLFKYTAEDEEYLFGRESETKDLMEMIRNNQLVVLYGESGTGKTSLINARLFPELKRKYYFPIYIRINYLSEITPLAQLRKIIHSTISEWDNTVQPFTDDLTLIDYAAKTSVFNGLVKPVLFFDQFEELFTIGQKYLKPEVLKSFIDQFADLIEVRLPTVIKKNQLVLVTNGAEEEIKTEECTENVTRFTSVISMRQDYIAQLDDLRFKIPSVSANRYRLKKFNDDQAMEAIIGPANTWLKAIEYKGPEDIIKKPVCQEIIRQLKILEYTRTERTIDSADLIKSTFRYLIPFKFTRYKKRETKDISLTEEQLKTIEIDPTILSLYCHQLYKSGVPVTESFNKITLEQVAVSPCDQIIRVYYKYSLGHKKIRNAVESFLITPDGRRLLVSMKDFIVDSKISEKEIDTLVKETGILRIYGEGAEQEIELAHDRIAKRALINRKEREANNIKVITGIVSLVCLLVLAAIVITTYLVSERNKRNSEVKNLKAEIETIKKDLKTQTATSETFAEQLLSKEKLSGAQSEKALQTLQAGWQRTRDSLKTNIQNFNFYRNRYLLDSGLLASERSAHQIDKNLLVSVTQQKEERDRDFTILQKRYDIKNDSLNLLKSQLRNNIPANPQYNSKQPQLQEQQTPGTNRVKYILWIDDHPVNHEQMAKILISKGIIVIDAKTNGDALKLLGLRSFDLIISDIGRDNMKETGIDILKNIQASKTPFIFFTTNEQMASYAETIKEAGALLVTNDEKELEAAMRKVLRY